MYPDLLSGSSYVQKYRQATKLAQDGFREGLEAGKESRLQDGFNDGFSLSTTALFYIAELRGEISGILSLHLMRGGTIDKSTESQLQELLGEVVLYETEMLNFSKNTYETWKSQSDSCVKPTQVTEQGNNPAEGAAGHGIQTNKEIKENLNLDKSYFDNERTRECDTDTCELDKMITDKSWQNPENIELFGDIRLHQFKNRLKELIN